MAVIVADTATVELDKMIFFFTRTMFMGWQNYEIIPNNLILFKYFRRLIVLLPTNILFY